MATLKGPAAPLDTVAIVNPDDPTEAIQINQADFDASVHKLWGEKDEADEARPEDALKGMSVQQLNEFIEERELDVDLDLNKADKLAAIRQALADEDE